MRLVTLHDAINNVDVAINVALIRFVRRATGSRVLVMFDKDHTLTITGTFEDVLKALQG